MAGGKGKKVSSSHTQSRHRKEKYIKLRVCFSQILNTRMHNRVHVKDVKYSVQYCTILQIKFNLINLKSINSFSF